MKPRLNYVNISTIIPVIEIQQLSIQNTMSLSIIIPFIPTVYVISINISATQDLKDHGKTFGDPPFFLWNPWENTQKLEAVARVVSVHPVSGRCARFVQRVYEDVGGPFCGHRTPISRWFMILDLVGGRNMTFIFPNSWDDDPIWLIFLRGVETTNQLMYV